jgi:hypothetical protein
MTEEERQAYIKKHPIIPRKKERPVNFDSDYPDYKWRAQRAAKKRWEKKD